MSDFLPLHNISICKNHGKYGGVVMRILLTNETYSIFIAKCYKKPSLKIFYTYAFYKFIKFSVKKSMLRFFYRSINRKFISTVDEFSLYAEGARKDPNTKPNHNSNPEP